MMIADARRAAEMTLLTVDTVAIDMILLTVDTRGAARQRRRMRHAEAGAVSRAERIISGEGTGRLWMILAEGVIQRARAGAPGRVRGCDGLGLGLRSGCVA